MIDIRWVELTALQHLCGGELTEDLEYEGLDLVTRWQWDRCGGLHEPGDARSVERGREGVTRSSATDFACEDPALLMTSHEIRMVGPTENSDLAIR